MSNVIKMAEYKHERWLKRCRMMEALRMEAEIMYPRQLTLAEILSGIVGTPVRVYNLEDFNDGGDAA